MLILNRTNLAYEKVNNGRNMFNSNGESCYPLVSYSFKFNLFPPNEEAELSVNFILRFWPLLSC